MTLAVAQTATKVLTDAGGATTTISFATLPATGSGVHAWYTDAAAANPIVDPTVDDNQGHGNYSKAVSATESGAGQMAGLWYLPKITTSAGTFTVTYHHNAASSNYSLVNISEISSGGGGITIDKTSSGTITTGTPVTATTAVTTAANEVVTAATTVDGSVANQGIGTGLGGTQVMVEQADTLHIAAAGDYVVVSATGAQTASYAITAAHVDAVCVIATFQEIIIGVPIAWITA